MVNGYAAGALDFRTEIGIFATNGNPTQVLLGNFSGSPPAWGFNSFNQSITIPGVSGVEGIVYDTNRRIAYLYTAATEARSAVLIKVYTPMFELIVQYDLNLNTYSIVEILAELVPFFTFSQLT